MMNHRPQRFRRRLQRPVRLFDLVHGRTRRWKMIALHRIEVIRHQWVEAAGEYVAQHVVPVRLVRKTLRVAVEDSSWLSEMTYLGPTILERLQALLPKNWVEEIRAVADEPMPKLPPREAMLVLPEATADMTAKASQTASQVVDQELRERIQKARLASLRRQAAQPEKPKKE